MQGINIVQTTRKIKALFLDIDGVLDSKETCHFYHEITGGNGYGGLFRSPPIIPTYNNVLWGQSLVDNLKKIIDDTHAKIVISSTWRFGHSISSFIDMFKIYGWENAPVIGSTPILHGKRGYEIQEYLDAHENIKNYVILDDSTDMLESQMKNFVNCDLEIGLTKEDAEKAISILIGEI